MSDVPRLIHESRTHSSSKPDRDFSSSCPFCAIGSTYDATSPFSSSESMAKALDPEQLDPPSFVLYSSEHVIAFLDIMPLTRGHVLVAPRKHRVKVGDLSPSEGAEIGRVLPLLARSVIKAVLPDIPHEDADYNVVQNNGEPLPAFHHFTILPPYLTFPDPQTEHFHLPHLGPGAAQVVPHVHFHIVPRPPLNYTYPNLSATTSSLKKKYPPNPQPSGRQATAILFGRGMREDLDYDDAAVLVESMRAAIREELARSFGKGEGSVSAETVEQMRSLDVGAGSEGGGNGSRNGRRLPWKV
ncbi:uncharacterized protein A1O5_08862 [Cladophialophora psammophila CBS 110553]|uniref:HIT domain-containing protein n=1 Tax=Cladophialophora psammophila CBS 110553 TaxID=1182543 RepID=W9WJE1_9EURO|nr:uncharacterized protein A1O5_08862 [Cladophialophora psammophila CBS 110553]EXJ68247.1 hypothetical protein A1O5_08862 [Cladophialophora psammophila CBS 110553]